MGNNAARSNLPSSFDPDRRRDAAHDESASRDWLYLAGGYGAILDFLCVPLAGKGNVKVLMSGPGLGKTYMLRAAVEELKAGAQTTLLLWTLFGPQDFTEHLLAEMGSREAPPADMEAARGQFERLLKKAQADGKKVVLAIDEAHNLSPSTLGSLATLLECETATPSQVTVLLAGLPSLKDHLAAPKAKPLLDRVVGMKTILPLSAEQTVDYIAARTAAVGSAPFAEEKTLQIAATSEGVLRIINQHFVDPRPQAQHESWQQRIMNALGVSLHGDQPVTDEVQPPALSPAPEPVIHIQESESRTKTVMPFTRSQGPQHENPELQSSAEVEKKVEPAVSERSAIQPHVIQLAEWKKSRPGTWTGTMGALAEATGISAEQISDVIENRIPDLRRSGVNTSVQRTPGRPRMIELSPLEPQETQEAKADKQLEGTASQPTKSAAQERRVKELLDAIENRSHASRRVETATNESSATASPEKTQMFARAQVEPPKPVEQVEPLTPPEQRTPVERTLPAEDFARWPQESSNLAVGPENEAVVIGPTSETGLRWAESVEQPNRGLALKVAIALVVISAVAALVLYLMAPGSAPRAANVTYGNGQTQPSEADEVTALLKDKSRMAATEDAANKGDAVAQRRLGLAMSLEKDAPPDRVTAYTWLVMAGSSGQTVNKSTLDSLSGSFTPKEVRDARYRLGRMFERGVGGAPNPVLADQWYLLGMREEDYRSRARSLVLEKRMSAAQISQAHTLSEEWTREHMN